MMWWGWRRGHIPEYVRQFITERLDFMSKQLDDLTAQVAANTTVLESAVTLISGLRQQIIDAGTDPAALQALTDALAVEDAKLAAAVAENPPEAP